MTALDTYVLIMSCEVVCFLQNNVLSNLFQPLLQSSQKKRKFSKDMRRINSRIPNSRSWDFSWQGYKEPSLRMEGSLQQNQPLTIWYTSGFVAKLIKLWWPWRLKSIAFERTVAAAEGTKKSFSSHSDDVKMGANWSLSGADGSSVHKFGAKLVWMESPLL